MKKEDSVMNTGNITQKSNRMNVKKKDAMPLIMWIIGITLSFLGWLLIK